MESVVDVVIVGAGLSGLSAAKLLTERGLTVVVLEARDRVGGRTYTVQGKDFGWTDLGGAYIGKTQRRVARLAKEFGIQFYNVSVEKAAVSRYLNRWEKHGGGASTTTFNPIAAWDLRKVERLIERLSAQVPVREPWKAPNAELWDSTTLKEFLDKTCWTRYAAENVVLTCRSTLCAEPHEASLLSFLWFMASGHGPDVVNSVVNGAQEMKFVGGAMQLSERLAECVRGKVRLNSVVIKVEQSEDKVTVHTAKGESFTGKYLISAMPLTLLNRVSFEPPLPPMKLQMIQRIPMGSIIKTMIFYEKRFWQDMNLSGEMFTDSGPVIYSLDDTKPDGTFPCIMGFVASDQARKLSVLSMAERRDLLAKHYAEVFRCPEFLKPIYYIDYDWTAEEYSGGCYTCNFPPGTLTRYGPEIRRPFRRTYFAGTETADYWAGYIEGAIDSGERAAKEVLHAAGRIGSEEIWREEPAGNISKL